MQVAKNTVVTLSYSVTDAEGTLVDPGEEPMVYLHGGYDDIFEKIEEALDGKPVGHVATLRLEPEDAFGEYDAELVELVPVAELPDTIEVGADIEATPSDGGDPELYTVTDIQDGVAVLDGNHPLAGLALTFALTVTDVRKATAQEIEDGEAG